MPRLKFCFPAAPRYTASALTDAQQIERNHAVNSSREKEAQIMGPALRSLGNRRVRKENVVMNIDRSLEEKLLNRNTRRAVRERGRGKGS